MEHTGREIGGAHAVIGIDLADFSTLHDDDQVLAIKLLYKWVKESLANHSVSPGEYRWSPAGDGGYLTFDSAGACRNAVDVALTLASKTHHPEWRPRNGAPLQLRLALHAGTVQEAEEFGGGTNIWGIGINIAARILSVAAPSQILMSRQYLDTYVRGHRIQDFEIGDVHWRTVKHGVQIEVVNVCQHNLGLPTTRATALRWRVVGDLWQRTKREYESLIHDAMHSGDPFAAIAAAKFLLELGERAAVAQLCDAIGRGGDDRSLPYPSRQHEILSHMPPALLMKAIECSRPLVVQGGQVLCEAGDPASSCYFPISGLIRVDVPGLSNSIFVGAGRLIGEFGLWVRNISRTARLEASEECLLLELTDSDFQRILKGAPDVAEAVHAIIKSRILDNVRRSVALFPGQNGEPAEAVADLSITCEKFAPGVHLDLARSVFIVFSGVVRLELRDGRKIDIRADGSFSNLPVVGIVSAIGAPDGSEATVVEEAVAVSIASSDLLQLQQTHPSIGDAWNALCGRRLGLISRATGN